MQQNITMPLLLAVVLLIATSYAAGLPTDSCSSGEQYWCQSLQTAEQCHAVEYCKDQVWNQDSPTVDKIAVCRFCQQMVKGIFSSLDGREDGFCQQLGVCKEHQQDTLFFHAKVVNVDNSNTCTDCKAFVTDMKQKMSSDDMKNWITKTVKTHMCHYLMQFEKQCDAAVDMAVPMILRMMAILINPDRTCSAMLFCPKSTEDIENDSITGVSPKECKDCVAFVNDVKQLILSDQFQKKIIGIAMEGCSRFHLFEKQCQAAVKQYLGISVQVLARLLNSKMVCTQIRFCSSSMNIHDEEMTSLDDETKFSWYFDADEFSPRVSVDVNGVKCWACEYLIKTIEGLLHGRVSQEAIVHILDKVCYVVPGHWGDECRMFIDHYGEKLVDLLAKEMEPHEICSDLFMCFTSTETRADDDEEETLDVDIEPVVDDIMAWTNLKPANTVEILNENYDENEEDTKALIRSENAIMCKACHLVMNELEHILEGQRTKDAIERALDRVCDKMHGMFRSMCHKLVENYSPQIIDALVSGIDFDAICSHIGLCKKLYEQSDDSKLCDTCRNTMSGLDDLLAGHPVTRPFVKKALSNICVHVVVHDSDICHKIVDQYSDQLTDAIVKGLRGDKACGYIHLC